LRRCQTWTGNKAIFDESYLERKRDHLEGRKKGGGQSVASREGGIIFKKEGWGGAFQVDRLSKPFLEKDQNQNFKRENGGEGGE